VFATGYIFTFHKIFLMGAWRACGLAGRWWELPVGCAAGDAKVYNTTSLKLVIPTVGQTGTTSVLQAVKELGFRSYGFEEAKVFAAHALRDGLADRASVATPISRCRVEALSLEPMLDLVPLVVEASPDAKFVLTWRDYPSWQRSSLTAFSKDVGFSTVMATLSSGFNLLPWMHALDSMVGCVSRLHAAGAPFLGQGEGNVLAYILHYMFPMYLEFNVFHRGTLKINGTEEAYLAHLDEIRRLVPRDRLLEFDVARHGWAELANFLGDGVSPPAGRPFPRTRRRGSRFHDEPLSKNPGTAAAAFVAVTFATSAGFTATAVAVRAAAAALAA